MHTRVWILLQKDPCLCTSKVVYNGWCLSHTERLKLGETLLSPIPIWPRPLSTQLGSHTKFHYPTCNMDQLQILIIHLSPCLIARPIIVTETYEACYPTRFEERTPQLGFCLGKDPCQSMAWSLSSLLSNNCHPCTRINITDLCSRCFLLLMSSPVSSTNLFDDFCCQVLLLS